MAGKGYVWFVEPIGSHTKKVISEILADEETIRGLKVEKGKKINAWRCQYDIVHYLVESRKMDRSLKFHIWGQRGNGPVRNCDFLFRRKRKKKSAKV